MKIQLLSIAMIQLAAVLANPLYTVKEISSPGSVTVTATKVYNIWNNAGNSTSYQVDIVSPLINSTSQEIRVAIQWQWKTRLGISNERVAFYGEVSKQRFDEFRVDRHIEVNGSYQFQNWFLPAVPKYSDVLPPQDPNDIDKYELKKAETPEISPENHTATFTFVVNRDEPYNEDNQIWINWGIFDSPFSTDLNNVYGSKEPQEYEMALTYSDYFDRVFINGIYWTIGTLGSLTLWAALPLQIVPMIVLQLYVLFQPTLIWFFAPISKNFTFDQYFTQVFLRWQFGTFSAIITMIVGDIITYIPIGWLAYVNSQNNNTLTNDDWTNFGAYTLVAWIAQLILNFIPALIAIIFLEG